MANLIDHIETIERYVGRKYVEGLDGKEHTQTVKMRRPNDGVRDN
jgi:hypothetical protein